ncbi:MAG: hypothetical protein UW46_C0007G0019 [Candidatus Yanofskybacteria bacterium GW2011_GWF1_44_227]|uniref:Uncharacterized protein n=1 Tax=Candidatus Yanofskybacteria bacterium GW2011_GWE2_40_11 TaxID=1619033 RepID=A0A0G0SYS8_9BACT|nr:MAG: hypothetical protein UT75_C0011G0018 [Candidatus Yanofskybacteria bacterium GW2011_GWE2_40_11]KKT15359.1 MAG: hypothetical protein UV97_C0008G0008 [Candidatus Yanofskybacteria bacterium GW2011_GWF2_43_596]KKT53043.1 MAG: hypothetical protein UW46_C0007G0019 [Candidatus Yanofskybacteria bacterium GW2011_GWF1_44_227]OGN35726.1 MAG: hypothetical protein A2241_02475 [Candidatus Yanofskybacteria bacterium RIFOXYA2_FULL_45_28]OGN35764.1 MAG: hypothetical protein A2207_01690 [Candidatus Yanofs
MALATTRGKKAALVALATRREENKTRERVDNSRLCAGSPMHFDCLSCGADIQVPESYTTRPNLCDECQALKDLGWLE